MTEFSNLGEHCHHCQLRSFTPSWCDKCGEVFCENHRAYSEHKCTAFERENAILQAQPKEKMVKRKCFKCKEPHKHLMKYKLCKYQYCVEHRHADICGGHVCVGGGFFGKETPLEPKVEKVNPNVYIIEMFKIWLKRNCGKHRDPVGAFAKWFDKKNTVTYVKTVLVKPVLFRYYKSATTTASL